MLERLTCSVAHPAFSKLLGICGMGRGLPADPAAPAAAALFTDPTRTSKVFAQGIFDKRSST